MFPGAGGHCSSGIWRRERGGLGQGGSILLRIRCFQGPTWVRRADLQSFPYVSQRIFWNGFFMGASLWEGRGRVLTRVGASDTPMKLPARKAAAGSENSQPAHHRASQFRTFPPFSSLPSLLLEPWLGQHCSLDYGIRRWGEKKLTPAPVPEPENSTSLGILLIVSERLSSSRTEQKGCPSLESPH